LAGVKDSKKLSKSRREALYRLIRSHPKIKSTIGLRSAAEIDSVNIRQATLAAMADAIADIEATEGKIWKKVDVRVDGKDVPAGVAGRAIVGGDDSDVTIGAASIVAKVLRDRVMERCDKLSPGYGFDRNCAYGTAEHIKALKDLGPTPIHRFSFKPLKQKRKRDQGTNNTDQDER